MPTEHGLQFVGNTSDMWYIVEKWYVSRHPHPYLNFHFIIYITSFFRKKCGDCQQIRRNKPASMKVNWANWIDIASKFYTPPSTYSYVVEQISSGGIIKYKKGIYIQFTFILHLIFLFIYLFSFYFISDHNKRPIPKRANPEPTEESGSKPASPEPANPEPTESGSNSPKY